MKRSLTLHHTPEMLKNLLEQNGSCSWDEMRNEHRPVYLQLSASLVTRQKGLCAFCEIDLQTENNIPAREIEHWRPKSKNPALTFDVSNLRAACRGGTDRYPANEQYRTGNPVPGPNNSCGSFKEDSDPDCLPLEKRPYKPDELPAHPPVFIINDDGNISPTHDCTNIGFDSKRLQATIDFLNLNCTRLKNARRAIRESIDKKLLQLLEAGEHAADDDSLLEKAMEVLSGEYSLIFHNNIPIFVTTIRSYFGGYLEEKLRVIPNWFTGPDCK